MLSVAELPEFIHTAQKLLTETERNDIIVYLAKHLKTGDLMEGTRGVRKLRWGRGDQANLTNGECNELADLAKLLIPA